MAIQHSGSWETQCRGHLHKKGTQEGLVRRRRKRNPTVKSAILETANDSSSGWLLVVIWEEEKTEEALSWGPGPQRTSSH